MTGKGQRTVKKTGETKKGKSFKNRENIKRKGETGNIRRKRELIPAKTGELKSLNNSAHGLICLEKKENQY